MLAKSQTSKLTPSKLSHYLGQMLVFWTIRKKFRFSKGFIMSCPTKEQCQTLAASRTYKIVMVRHGESEWNKLNLFCGWFNAELSDRGRSEAERAGKALKDAGYSFDMAFTSVLKRANNTLEGILQQLGQTSTPIKKSWRLNERHYGGLTGIRGIPYYGAHISRYESTNFIKNSLCTQWLIFFHLG
ncbi:unnamed protein product [Acanthoscelides obtectus]|uniref:Phosphoglycerate mutase n=1 Tax=Acanthoscelides obtectus TaxID=200917 RepID=A0A9P0PAI4_ACAOB|nr:unnamed protein product [Acanthoscelides obtectus]CAK1632498.1 2,3-bisphosphoglycerate-dependent phosphoglycerate mutase [Acanthoscelides obtectus]